MSSSDMEENGIQVDIDISKVIVNSQDIEKILGLKEERLEEFSLEDQGVSEETIRSSTRLSSLLTPVSSSSNDLPQLISRESIDLSQQFMDSPEESGTVPTVRKMSDMFLETPLRNLEMPKDFAKMYNDLGTFMNATTAGTEESSTLAPNQSSSSWSSEEIGAVAIVSLMVPFILCSNLFVIMSVVRFRRLHTPTNYFITSLAAVDIFVALATPFVVVIEVFHFGNASSSADVVLCLLPNRVLMMACGVSVLTLATIAYDRHTALVSPLEYVNIMTTRKVGILMALTWIYSALIVWFPLMAGWYDVPKDVAPCSANLIQGKAPLLFLSAIFVPSCVAILVCYFRIFMVARHHAKAIAAVEFAVHRRLQVKFMIKDTKYAKTLALVIGVFLLLWMPYLLCIFIKVITSTKYNVWVQIYLILLAVFNSGINPWIYAFKNNELKAAFKRLFKEFCSDKFCKSEDRRASLVSTISSTPRLSRTDSRMVSIVPEITVDTISEKLKRSLDSLDESEGEIEHGLPAADFQQRRQTIAEGFLQSPSTFLEQKNSRRHTSSCSNLDVVKDITLDKSDSSKMSRSISMDYISPNQTYDCDSNDSGIYYQIDHEYDISTVEDHYEILNSMSSGNKPKTLKALSSPLSSPSTASHSRTTKSVSLPSSPIHLQPPPQSSSSSSSSPKRSSLLKIHKSPKSSKNHGTLESNDHKTDSYHHNQSTSSHHLPHTHSFSYINEALQHDEEFTSRSHYSTESSSSFHPYFENLHVPTHCHDDHYSPSTHSPHPHVLPHTHSCPTFEGVSSFHPYLPYLWNEGVTCSHLGELLPVSVHDNNIGFVGRVKSEDEYSSNTHYLV